ncbi:hypothetical protein QOT17_004272 [Balamuthia mandrillaris]
MADEEEVIGVDVRVLQQNQVIGKDAHYKQAKVAKDQKKQKKKEKLKKKKQKKQKQRKADADEEGPIQYGPLPAEELAELERTIAKMQEHLSMGEEGWRRVRSDQGVVVSINSYDKEAVKSVKASGLFPSSPAVLLRTMSALDYYPKIDPLYAGGRVVAQYADHHEILYSIYAMGMLFSPRDFVFLEGRRAYPDGSRILVTRSIEREDVPPVSGHIRGHIHHSGWFVEPCTKKPPTKEEIKEAKLTSLLSEEEEAGAAEIDGTNWCRATFLAQVDVKGWIPAFVVNAVSGKVGDGLLRLRGFLKDNAKEIQRKHAREIAALEGKQGEEESDEDEDEDEEDEDEEEEEADN